MSSHSTGKQNAAEVMKAYYDSSKILGTESSGKKFDEASEKVGKSLATIKSMLYGTAEQEPQAEVTAKIAQEFYDGNGFEIMIKNIAKVNSEARKDVAEILGNLLRRQVGARAPTVDHLFRKGRDILAFLCKGYESPDIALDCGVILRECIRYESLAKLLITSNQFYDFFQYVKMSNLEIASDAFATFKGLLTRHETMASSFLEQEYDDFMPRYSILLSSENNIAQKQALKLLGELLLKRHNIVTITKYTSDPDNLKTIISMLRDKSRNIQFEAFHVFKVFVANPNKPRPIEEILIKNKAKLFELLKNIHSERTDDEQFNDEKAYTVQQMNELN